MRNAISSDWNGEELDADHPSAVRLEAGNLTFTGAGSGIVDETVELAGARGRLRLHLHPVLLLKRLM